MQLFRLDVNNAAALEGLGLSADAVRRTFLFPRDVGEHRIEPLDGCPKPSVGYMRREYRAAEQSFDALARRSFEIADPVDGTPIATTGCFALVNSPASYFLPLAYRFHHAKRPFIAIVSGHTGRISELVFDDGLTLYDVDRRAAEIDAKVLPDHLGLGSSLLPKAPRTVAVVDMISNFGHQIINHLSGLERLAKVAPAALPDEIWISGKSFFGDVPTLFPELASRMKVFQNRLELGNAINASPHLAVRIGSNIMRRDLRDRLMRAVPRPASPKEPGTVTLAITLRTKNRVCVNLPEVVHALHRALHKEFPRIRYVLDGWVIADSEYQKDAPLLVPLTLPAKPHIGAEVDLAAAILKGLSPRPGIALTTGMSMSASVELTSRIDAYFAHVGTLQHKLGFLTDAPGLMHGPRSQLEHRDSGPYHTEAGTPPDYLPPEAVEDVPSDFDARSANYRIVDIPLVCEKIAALLRKARDSATHVAP